MQKSNNTKPRREHTVHIIFTYLWCNKYMEIVVVASLPPKPSTLATIFYLSYYVFATSVDYGKLPSGTVLRGQSAHTIYKRHWYGTGYKGHCPATVLSCHCYWGTLSESDVYWRHGLHFFSGVYRERFL